MSDSGVCIPEARISACATVPCNLFQKRSMVQLIVPRLLEVGENQKVYCKLSAICACILCLTVFGCSKSQPLGQVVGTVTFNSKPLEEGTIIFTVSGARDASGLIKNGEIQQVTSFKPGDGVPVGEAKVAIIAVKSSANSISGGSQSDAGNPASPGSSTVMTSSEFLIPTRYTNPEKSGLTATITKGKNEVNFDLTK